MNRATLTSPLACAVLAVATWTSSCTDSNTGLPLACTEGRQETCPCPAGAPNGVQVCTAQNIFGPCQCGAAGDATGGDTSSDATGDAPPTDGGLTDGDAVVADGSTPDEGTIGQDVVPWSDVIVSAPDIGWDGFLQITDGSVGDVEPSENCGKLGQPCGYGAIKGLVCAPNNQILVSGALVTLTAVDCDGNVLTYQTYSAADGTYYFPSVPCGNHSVHIQSGQWSHDYAILVEAGEFIDHTGALTKICFASNSVPIAVLWGQWDDQQDLLADLGFATDYYNFEWDYFNDTNPDDIDAVKMLRDPSWMAQYKIIFFNCGSAAIKYVDTYPEIAINLMNFVNQGGSLYASDLSWAYIEAAFPNAIDFLGSNDLPSSAQANDGPQQVQGNESYPATIDDPAMAGYVGTSTFTTEYGAGPLIAIQEGAPQAVVHIKGIVHIDPPSPAVCGDGVCDSSEVIGCADCPTLFSAVDFVLHAGPMVVSYQPSPASGRIVYTTFHNDEQADELMTKILYYLVFLL